MTRLRLWLASAVLIFALLLGDHVAQAQFGAFGGPRAATLGGVTGWILAEQAAFYRTLANAIRLAKSDGSALWGLIGISFVYGIFHAAGPGHGKAVISSYLIANEETWRRGVVLSFASAVMQSITAITIVGVAAVLLGATAKLMSDTVRIVEVVSYGLIVAIGARLLWAKGHGFFDALRELKSERAYADDEPHDHTPSGHSHDCGCHHAHVHHHDVSGQDHPPSSGAHCHGEELDVLPWGHAHGPEPQQLAGPGGWRRGFSAIVAVGLRPCSGAIIVLVFALAQGLFWAGIASTFVMGLGTAITVGSIATLAVGAKTVATRLATRPVGYGSVLVRGIELGAAGLVFAFGILLLTGYTASERMGLF